MKKYYIAGCFDCVPNANIANYAFEIESTEEDLKENRRKKISEIKRDRGLHPTEPSIILETYEIKVTD